MKLAGWIALVACVPAALAAQQSQLTTLRPANGRIDSVSQLFTGSARELSDGRLLLNGRGRSPIAWNFATNTGQSLDGIPAGMMHQLPHDSTLIEDRNSGWVFVDNVKLLGMLPKTNPVVAATTMMNGASANGAVLSVGQARSKADSEPVLLIDRVTAVQTFVTNIWHSPPVMGGVPAPTFVVNESAVMAPDGWIAVVRANPYRMDWRKPNGEWIRGKPLPVLLPPMDRKEQEVYAASFNLSLSELKVTEWPAAVVAFNYPQLLIAPDGDVLVHRFPTAEARGTSYDVINRRGDLVRQVLVSPGFHDAIVAFGASSIYVWVAGTGRYGSVERHPWP